MVPNMFRPQCVKTIRTSDVQCWVKIAMILNVKIEYFHSKERIKIIDWNIGHCLTHWGRVTHIGVGNLAIIGSDNGLSPSRRQAIIWTNAGILLNGPLETNFSEISIEIHTFSFNKMHLKMLSAKRRLFCPGLNVLSLGEVTRVFKGLLFPITKYTLFVILRDQINYRRAFGRLRGKPSRSRGSFYSSGLT